MDGMNSGLARLQRQLDEAYQSLWGSVVEPGEVYDDDGEGRWLPLGVSGGTLSAGAWTAERLRDVRAQCRALATTNEFAINGHENRISFVVGTGHSYQAVARKGVEVDESWPRQVQKVLEDFLRVNRWQQRQQELVRRKDRDGEAFLRYFTAAEGTTRIRFIEPDLVATPPEQQGRARLGVVTDRDDVEDVLGYFVDGEWVDAADVQHRKANVDANVLRGVPLFYPVRKNLQRAEKLLRNMSTVAEIQSAIALIRKHASATRSGVEQFVADGADYSQRTPGVARTTAVKRYAPGTIVDAYAGTEYEFPAAAIDASSFVTVLQAELRAIASRLVMPEFMLTSDASNSNYASTMVAEGPAMRMFARLQQEQIEDDLDVMRHVVRCAVQAGRLPRESLECVEIRATAPSLSIRDRLAETERMRIEFQCGILSPQTWAARSELDYEQEQANLTTHREQRAQRREESRDVD